LVVVLVAGARVGVGDGRAPFWPHGGPLVPPRGACFAGAMPLPQPAPHDAGVLDTFPNPYPGRDFEITFECPEFTCICPKTSQPDFAVLTIRYVPDQLCVELKSLKLYLWSFRNVGAFHEKVTNDIASDLLKLLRPRKFEIVGDFKVRGGITTKVTVRAP
jgi:7-cyano-7-deazaguanine reductase